MEKSFVCKVNRHKIFVPLFGLKCYIKLLSESRTPLHSSFIWPTFGFDSSFHQHAKMNIHLADEPPSNSILYIWNYSSVPLLYIFN